MAMLVGEMDQMIDSKHRLAISASFRDQIDPEEDGSSFILFLGPDLHLWLYPDLYYRRSLQKLDRGPFPKREDRETDLFFAMARVLKPDKQGRVVLPEKSMRRAVIADQVTLVGVRDHIEIWPTDEWERRVEQDLSNYGETLYRAAERRNDSGE